MPSTFFLSSNRASKSFIKLVQTRPIFSAKTVEFADSSCVYSTNVIYPYCLVCIYIITFCSFYKHPDTKTSISKYQVSKRLLQNSVVTVKFLSKQNFKSGAPLDLHLKALKEIFANLF